MPCPGTVHQVELMQAFKTDPTVTQVMLGPDLCAALK